MGTGVFPYSPFTRPLDSLETILYLSPIRTFKTACVPTIWLVGVTSGGKPKSSLTLGTSRRTSSYLSSFPCCLSCETRFESIPPGTWYKSVFTSTPNTLGSKRPLDIYLSLNPLKYSAISLNKPKLSPVS